MYEKPRYGYCRLCGVNTIVSDHHKFRQSKTNRKLYPDFIDRNENLEKSVCNKCHEDLRNISEFDFCAMFNIEMRSKLGKLGVK